jgi:hypothetical protein
VLLAGCGRLKMGFAQGFVGQIQRHRERLAVINLKRYFPTRTVRVQPRRGA